MGKLPIPPSDVMTQPPGSTWKTRPDFLADAEAEAVTEAELARRLETLERLAARPRTWSVTIFEADGLLLTPLPVKVEEFADEVVASLPELEVFGSAATEADALNALKRELRTLHDELIATPDDELGEIPQRWKRALAAVVRSP